MQVTHKTFSGGYSFKKFAGIPTEKVVKPDIPPTVTIPLKQGFGGEVTAVVEQGDYVKVGQKIGENKDNISSPVHASVNGIVKEIINIDLDGNEVNAIVIEHSEETIGWQSSINRKKRSIKEIGELLYQSGVTSLDRSGIPTLHGSSIISPNEVEDTIINGVEAEAFNLSIDVLLEKEQIENFIDGIKILKIAMPQSRFHLVLGQDEKKIIDKLNDYLNDMSWLKLYTVAPKYPINRDELLIPTLLGKAYPTGYLSANIGIIVLSMQTIMHVFDAVVLETPVIEKTIALGGPGWKENVHIKVPIGTSLDYIVKRYMKDNIDSRLIVNSLLTSQAINPELTYIDKTTEVLIALPENRNREVFSFLRAGKKKDSFSNGFLSSLFSKSVKSCESNIHGEHRPCISCGFCEDACPAGVIPHLLHRHVERKILGKRVEELGIFKCMHCNLCSYVCTSKIGLAKSIKEGQQAMEEEGFGHENYTLTMFELNGLEQMNAMKDIV